MRVGDVSRGRRFSDPARLRWYACYRTLRFAMRMHGLDTTVRPDLAVNQQLRQFVGRVPLNQFTYQF